jgi:hypothetical protein
VFFTLSTFIGHYVHAACEIESLIHRPDALSRNNLIAGNRGVGIRIEVGRLSSAGFQKSRTSKSYHATTKISAAATRHSPRHSENFQMKASSTVKSSPSMNQVALLQRASELRIIKRADLLLHF